MSKNPVRVLLTGGGSGGPTLPLLALAEEIIQQKNDSIFLFLGSKGGPERQMVEQAGIAFEYIPSGKLPISNDICLLSELSILLC